MSIIFKQFQDSREDQGNNQQDIFQNIAFYQYRGVFALLRLISHTLQGETPLRSLIKIKAPVPTPPSILSKKGYKKKRKQTKTKSLSNRWILMDSHSFC